MLRRALFLVLVAMSCTPLLAQSQAKLFLDVLSACGAGPNQRKLTFLGGSNADGPGGIYEVSRSGPTLKFRWNSYYTQTAYAAAINSTGTQPADSPCNSVKVPNWQVGVDVPISIAAIGNVDATTSIKSAKNITVSAASIAFTQIPSGVQENAINAITHDKSEFSRVVDGRSYALLNAYWVKDLKITYQLDYSLNAGAKASIAASPAVNVGTTTSPLNATVAVANNGQQVTVTFPGGHWIFGQLFPIAELNSKIGRKPSSRTTIGQRNWFTSCAAAGLPPHCSDSK